MKIIPTAAVLGAEIAGVDLSRHLDDATFTAIERAYDEYGVIFFAGSRFPRQQVALVRRFGDRINIFGERWSVPGNPEIVVLSNITEGGQPTGVRRAGEQWHSDMCYTAEPSAQDRVLHAMPRSPGAAPAPAGGYRVRQRRRGLGRLAGSDAARPRGCRPSISGSLKLVVPAYEAEIDRNPPVSHPIVRSHPSTGRERLDQDGATTARASRGWGPTRRRG